MLNIDIVINIIKYDFLFFFYITVVCPYEITNTVIVMEKLRQTIISLLTDTVTKTTQTWLSQGPREPINVFPGH